MIEIATNKMNGIIFFNENDIDSGRQGNDYNVLKCQANPSLNVLTSMVLTHKKALRENLDFPLQCEHALCF